MIRVEEHPCEVCGSGSSERLWSTTWPEHRYPGTFTMRRCASCGLLFNSPRLNDEQLGQLYGRNYYFFSRTDARELSRIVPMYQRTVGLVADRVPGKRALDIGCGRGYLPAVLKALGWDARGVEISADAAQYARERFGLDVFTGTIEQYASSPAAQQLPLVTAIDVIEHVPSPRKFVQAIARVVSSGGRIIIDTPNAAAHNITVKHVEWQGFNPFHIYLFTIENLSQLLEQHGFRVERAFSYHNTPLDRTPEPASRRIRNMFARNLKRAGLLGPAARAYFMLKGMTANNGTLEPHLRTAVEQVRLQPSWDATSDAIAPLSATRGGDNIVVIATRT